MLIRNNFYYCNSFEYRKFLNDVLDGLSLFNNITINESVIETIQDYYLYTDKSVEKVILEMAQVLQDNSNVPNRTNKQTNNHVTNK